MTVMAMLRQKTARRYADHSWRALLSILSSKAAGIPDPVEASDKGCTLTALQMTRNFELAFLSGTGYPPNTDVHYRVSSEMTSAFVVKSDSTGTIRTSVIPFPPRKQKEQQA